MTALDTQARNSLAATRPGPLGSAGAETALATVNDTTGARLRGAVADALDSFLSEKRAVLAAVDDALVPVAEEVVALAGGGKRLRPAFAYWGWRAVPAARAEDDAAVLRAVAALELVHGFALVHDDVMDAAATRRGRPATHVGFAARHREAGLTGDAELFGTGAAILVGDLALVWSDELLRLSGISAEALARARPVWDAMRTEVTAGQYLDLVRGVGGLPGRDGALRVARYKSAGYTVQRPLHLGAAIADAGPEVVEAFTDIALPLGEAFQLRDDVLGVFGDPTVTGKSAAEDIREGKQTLLVALTQTQADAAGRDLLRQVLGNQAAGSDELDSLRDLMRSTGALDAVEDRISRQTAAARRAIAESPVLDEAREALDALAVAATHRSA